MDCLFISAGLCVDGAGGLPVCLCLLVCMLTELVDCLFVYAGLCVDSAGGLPVCVCWFVC